MLLDLLKEVLLELVRAFLLEGLCQRVKDALVTARHRRRMLRHQALFRWLQMRDRNRLLHRITTGEIQKL